MLLYVMVCIALDGLEQVWVEWKRMLWGELAMAVREKTSIVFARVFPPRTS
jgi:hypothetical protein